MFHYQIFDMHMIRDWIHLVSCLTQIRILEWLTDNYMFSGVRTIHQPQRNLLIANQSYSFCQFFSDLYARNSSIDFTIYILSIATNAEYSRRGDDRRAHNVGTREVKRRLQLAARRHGDDRRRPRSNIRLSRPQVGTEPGYLGGTCMP